MPLWKLAVRADFAAAHALRHYHGKCESTHGHNFAVETVVEGRNLNRDTEILADFTDLKADLRQVLASLDHQDLNKHPAFLQHNPSSENLAAYIFRELSPLVRARGVSLRQVSVSENASQTATYLEE
ncbi:MAG: 6-carboxytetrahydropterin synthase QueD [Desulfovibrionaceae bacterium]|nr:6-carboxytetrahydropterin synthase QueD [Desulfovibrionaceae bacterium]